MAIETSFLSLILNASMVVKFVMLVLLLLSVFSWAIIFQRNKMLKIAAGKSDSFEKQFWSGIDLSEHYGKLSVHQKTLTGMDAIFVAGFQEFIKLHKKNESSQELVLSGVQRVMRTAMSKELVKLESNLPFLATVQSMSPYIGLFGTVWGIMHSFRQLSSVQQATIAMVAPGISEALIATAMGLVAAIPAGIAYNRYINKVDAIAGKYQIFQDEFSSLLQRNLL